MRIIQLNLPETTGKLCGLQKNITYIPTISGLHNVHLIGRGTVASNASQWETMPAVIEFSTEGLVIFGLSVNKNKNDVIQDYTYNGYNGMALHSRIQSIRLNNNEMYITLPNYWTITVNLTLQALTTQQLEQDCSYLGQVQCPFNVTASGNLLDLDSDLTYAQDINHLTLMLRHRNLPSVPSNIDLIQIKCHYLPEFNSTFFNNCLHTFTNFLVEYMSQGIILIQISANNGLYFFTGYTLTVYNNIADNAVYYSPGHRQRVILTTNLYMLILRQSKPKIIRQFPYIKTTNMLSNYISNTNPLFLPKLQYINYIKKEQQIIKDEYINKASIKGSKTHHLISSAKMFTKSSFQGTLNWFPSRKLNRVYSVLGIVGIELLIFGLTKLSHLDIYMWPQTFIFYIICPLCAYLCLCAWYSFIHSQALTIKKPIIFSSVVAISLLGFALLFGIDAHHTEVHISTHDFQYAIGKYNYYDTQINYDPATDTNSAPSKPNFVNIKKLSLSRNKLQGKDKFHNHFTFYITNYFYDTDRKGIVLKGYYSNHSQDWVNILNNKDYQPLNDDTTAKGYKPNNIFLLRKHNNLIINFAGNASDSTIYSQFHHSNSTDYKSTIHTHSTSMLRE